MNDTIMFGLVIAGAGFIVIYVLAAILNFVVALNSRPIRRATWTAGIAYVLTSIAAVIGIFAIINDPSTPSGRFPVDPLTAPLFLAPGALLIFLLRLWGYRTTWVEDESELREGEGLANNDWRAGLYLLALAILLLAARVLWRVYVRS